GAGAAPEPSEGGGEEEGGRGLGGGGGGREVGVEEGKESARHSRESRGDGEGGDADVVGGKAERLRGDLAALDGETRSSPRGAAEIGGEPEGERRPRQHRPVVGGQRGLGGVGDAARTTPGGPPPDQHPLDDEAEGG